MVRATMQAKTMTTASSAPPATRPMMLQKGFATQMSASVRRRERRRHHRHRPDCQAWPPKRRELETRNRLVGKSHDKKRYPAGYLRVSVRPGNCAHIERRQLMTCGHDREIDSAQYAAEREHGRNAGFEEAPVDGIGRTGVVCGGRGLSLSRGLFQFGDQLRFVHAVRPGEELQLFLGSERSAAAQQAVTVEDLPARWIPAQYGRQRHLAVDQEFGHRLMIARMCRPDSVTAVTDPGRIKWRSPCWSRAESYGIMVRPPPLARGSGGLG